EFDLTVEWIDVVPVLIDLIVSDADHDVAHRKARFRCRRAGINAGHVDPSGLAALVRKLSQLRIARWEESEARRGKTFVRLLLRILQEVRDNRSVNGVHHLGALIIAT